jgi:hypothetical protein
MGLVELRVCVEVGAKKVFASALDWPGWARSGRTEQAAVEALVAYADRYRLITDAAGLALPSEEARLVPVVLERAPGNASTDFGAPDVVAEAELAPADADWAARAAAILRASWARLDELAVTAPEALRKGPRGGGRDRDAVVAHVVEAERSYARKIGVRHRPFEVGDAQARAALRTDIAAALAGELATELPPTPWPPRYAARRLAWHVLDHVWEIEDKST